MGEGFLKHHLKSQIEGVLGMTDNQGLELKVSSLLVSSNRSGF